MLTKLRDLPELRTRDPLDTQVVVRLHRRDREQLERTARALGVPAGRLVRALMKEALAEAEANGRPLNNAPAPGEGAGAQPIREIEEERMAYPHHKRIAAEPQRDAAALLTAWLRAAARCAAAQGKPVQMSPQAAIELADRLEVHERAAQRLGGAA